jgi:hypothetical protein
MAQILAVHQGATFRSVRLHIRHREAAKEGLDVRAEGRPAYWLAVLLTQWEACTDMLEGAFAAVI